MEEADAGGPLTDTDAHRERPDPNQGISIISERHPWNSRSKWGIGKGKMVATGRWQRQLMKTKMASAGECPTGVSWGRHFREHSITTGKVSPRTCAWHWTLGTNRKDLASGQLQDITMLCRRRLSTVKTQETCPGKDPGLEGTLCERLMKLEGIFDLGKTTVVWPPVISAPWEAKNHK